MGTVPFTACGLKSDSCKDGASAVDTPVGSSVCFNGVL